MNIKERMKEKLIKGLPPGGLAITLLGQRPENLFEASRTFADMHHGKMPPVEDLGMSRRLRRERSASFDAKGEATA
jgi:hypothetical protein